MTVSHFVIGSSLLMLAAGFGIPMMANLNAGLGVRLSNPLAAVVFLTFFSFIVSSFLLLATGGVGDLPKIEHFKTVETHYFLAGILFIFYITSITWAAPRIGVGNAIFLVLLGQLMSATIIDHFGLLGAIKSEITPKRVLGLVFMAIGIFLARREL